MSLIPSESYSFPDHFTKTVAASRKPKPEPEVIEPVRNRPALVALPNPKPRPVAKPRPLPKPEIFAEPEAFAEPELVTEREPLVMPEFLIERGPVTELERLAELESLAGLEPLVPPEHVIKSEPVAELQPFAEPEPLVAPEHMMDLEPLEEPEPIIAKEISKPAPKITPRIPNPALRRANAPPPRIPEAPVRKVALPTLKPKVRWNNRAPAMDLSPAANNGNGNGHGNGANHFVPEAETLLPPAQNVIQMKPAPPVPRPPRGIPRPEKILRPPSPLAKSIPVAPPPPLLVAKLLPKAAPPKPAAFAPPQKPAAPTRPLPPPPLPKRENARPVARAQAKPPMRVAPRPVIAPDPQADFFEDFAESNETVVSKRRRKGKMRRFMVCEGIVVGILIPLAIVGIAFHPESAALRWILNIFTISAAVAAAIVPIIFFAARPTLPEIER